MKYTKLQLMFLLIHIIGITLLSIGISKFINIVFGIMLMFVLTGIGYLLNSKYMFTWKIVWWKCLFGLVGACVFTMQFKQYFIAKNMGVSIIWQYIVLAGMVLFIWQYCIRIEELYYAIVKKNNHSRGRIITLGTGIFLLLYIVMLFLPISIFLGNVDEFDFSYIMLWNACFPRFVIIGIALWGMLILLPGKFYDVVLGLVVALDINVYIQYIFFNIHLGELNGTIYSWSDHPFFSIFNLFMWLGIIIFSACVFLKTKSINYKYVVSGMLALVAIQTINLIWLVISAPEEANKVTTYVYSGEQQYTVGSKENIIVLVLDAVDNRYIMELLDETPEIFEPFKDFTLYDNTASVYDYTGESLNQMLTGYCRGDENNYCDEFYARVKNAGYKIHFYGYGGCSGFPSINSYIDNCETLYIDYKESSVINYKSLFANSMKISWYEILPCVMKNIIAVDEIDFNCFLTPNKESLVFYENEDFATNMKLEIDDTNEKLYVLEHIDGAHYPCDDYNATSARCLEICGNYIEQLKRLGLYDTATIIIMADHGLHDQQPPYTWPTAGTPMFMIKEARRCENKMTISHAPIYHKDYLSTILVNMGLFDYDEDYIKYGPSIYDFSENALRERSWYDRCEQGYRVYTYTGDTEELNRCVNNDIYTIYTY